MIAMKKIVFSNMALERVEFFAFLYFLFLNTQIYGIALIAHIYIGIRCARPRAKLFFSLSHSLWNVISKNYTYARKWLYINMCI